jgi:hypothetical protein
MDLLSKKIINDFAKQYIDTLKENILRNGKVASGNLVRSLDYRVAKVMNEINIEIIANEYLQYIDQGVSGTERKYNTPFRYTNKMPPIKELSNWARIKGINTNNVFGIARSIYKFGIKPTRVIRTTDRMMERKVDSSLTREIAANVENYVGYTFVNKVFDRKGQAWDANSPQGKFIMNMRGQWDLNL